MKSAHILILALFLMNAMSQAAENAKAVSSAKPNPPKSDPVRVESKGELKTEAPRPEVIPKGESKHEVKPEVPKAEVVKFDKRRDRVSITDDPVHSWMRKDTVCIYRTGRALACGKVIALGIRGAVVQLSSHTASIKTGDEARYFEPEKTIPQLTDNDLASENILDAKPYTFDIALGYHLSLDLRFPTLHFYWAVSPWIAVGIQPAYIAVTGDVVAATIKGYGALLSIDYFNEQYFRGFWVQLGSGFYHITAKNATLTEIVNTPIVSLLVGWREDWAHGLNVGFGFGGRFISPLSGLITDVKYSSVNGFALAEVGFSF